MEQAEQPELELRADGECLMDRRRWRRKEEFVMVWEKKIRWDSRSKTHPLPNVVLSNLLLTAFTLKENVHINSTS